MKVKSADSGNKKVFILDTNILLDDPLAVSKLGDNIIVIPFSVIDELDGFKKRSDELGANARRAARLINKLKRNGKSLSEGVPIEDEKRNLTGGILFLDNESGTKDLAPLKTHADTPDHRIMSVALRWKNANKLKRLGLSSNTSVILITNDINLRLKADSFNIRAEYRKMDKVSEYKGYREISDDIKLFNLIADNDCVSNSDLNLSYKFMPNECLAIKKGSSSLLAIHKQGKIEKINLPNFSIHGIKPKNAEQIFALNILLDPKIKLVTINGKAGTGKTLLALAAALHQLDEGAYDRIAVARPIVTMGNDIGFLPGDIEEKLNAWMGPIYDNLDVLFSREERKKKHTVIKKNKTAGVDLSEMETWQDLINKKLLCIEPLAYIRGRSIPNQILIIDEAQNLTRHEIKTIITRIGEGAKIILTGDIEQIDNPYLNKNNNGLSIVIEKFKDWSLAGHITLIKGERSEVAEYVSNNL